MVRVYLGGVYYGGRREVNVQFVNRYTDTAAWDLLSRGKKTSHDGTLKELREFLAANGFVLDHIERW